MISHDERLAAYENSGNLIPSPVEFAISKECTDDIVKDFARTFLVSRAILECSKLCVYGTDYKIAQFVILPESTNSFPFFGKIVKLLSCSKYGYLFVQKTKSLYCHDTDLYILTETKQYDIIPCLQLPSYHTLEAYPVGEGKKISISLRHFIPEHLNQ